jgi:SAM-dependent methyltransferase
MTTATQQAEERLRLEFNEWAAAGRGASMERGHLPAGAQAIASMALPPDAHVLDLGCGSGWATRLMAGYASGGRVIGLDVSDEMVRLARASSSGVDNVDFYVGGAERMPFNNEEFTHAFSMESIYYYPDVGAALKEVHRVLMPGGLFVAVVDLYHENAPSHQWIPQLKVPVHLLSISQYRSLFEGAGFRAFDNDRLIDTTPVPADYTGGFSSHEDFVRYREAGSLMISGRAAKAPRVGKAAK